jgi:heme/copper-type cytochrome/quinol oxidase subunit 1
MVFKVILLQKMEVQMNTLRINSLLLALLIGLNVAAPAQAGQAKDPVKDNIALGVIGTAAIYGGYQLYHSEDKKAVWAKTQLKKAAPVFALPAYYASQQIPTGVSYVVRNLPTFIACLPTLAQVAKIGAVGVGISTASALGYMLYNAQPTEKPKTNNSESWISCATKKIAKTYNETFSNPRYIFGAAILTGILMNENSPLHKYERLLTIGYTAAAMTGYAATWFAPEADHVG